MCGMSQQNKLSSQQNRSVMDAQCSKKDPWFVLGIVRGDDYIISHILATRMRKPKSLSFNLNISASMQPRVLSRARIRP
eukprot:scaffold10394_cov173-Amphora_coffeaeformis.AAC.4